MTLASSMTTLELPEQSRASEDALSDAQALLRQCFGADFTLLDTAAEQYVSPVELLSSDSATLHAALCRGLIERGRAEIIAEHDPVVLLAIPLLASTPGRFAALAPFLIHSDHEATICASAAAIGCRMQASAAWAQSAAVWSETQLLSLSELVLDRWKSQARRADLQQEVDDLSQHLNASYEEISLLYRITQNLKISDSDEDLGRVALEWLATVVPSSGLALDLLPHRETLQTAATPAQHVFLTHGDCPLDQAEFMELLRHLNLDRRPHALVCNPLHREQVNWPFDRVRQAVFAPLMEGNKLHGWLSAFNHTADREFGSQEASLLSSVAAILGIHSGNLELYRQQNEFLAGVVRALTSAIDAKDPYTCGHSDRVARVAVCLADYLGCSSQEQETIYLSGLLHDIGKIGIDDQVLRKPGKLTESEYEHIKLHAEIGYRILKDIPQLDEVLPAVRHHHEAWNGTGYPFGLAGEEIPFYARIIAVADAFDAMSSDRPYRRGMADDKLDMVLRNGAGHQWDARVVDAFFELRDTIRRIARREREPVILEAARIS